MLQRRSIFPFNPLALASLSLLLTIPPVMARAEEAGKADAQKEAPAKEAPAAPQGAKSGAAPAPDAGATAAQKQHLITVKAEPFPEKTSVHGEIKTDLQGVWLLLTRAEIVPGKFRNFPQLLKITKGKDGLAFQLLDVQLPSDVRQNIQEADRTLAAWSPSSEIRDALGKNWAGLPKITEKSVNDPPRGKVEYALASPDRYGEAFGALNPTIDTTLKESVFAMQIVETYKPIKEVTDTRISQLMQRKVIYGAKSADKDVVQGTTFVGFIASGNGTPLPLQFGGQFVMYRLAKAA